MTGISSIGLAPVSVADASTPDASRAREPVRLPEPLSVLLSAKAVGVVKASEGSQLSEVWASQAKTMKFIDFQKLNSHLMTVDRQAGELLFAGDEIAVPLSAIRDGFVARGPADLQQLSGERQGVDAEAFKKMAANRGVYQTAAAPEPEGFTFQKLGKAMVEDADYNIDRLAAEQDAVGKKHSGVVREVLGGLAAAGAFMGKTFHGLERLAGLAIQAIAVSGDQPERVFAETIESVKTTSVGDAVSGAVRVAEGLGAAAVNAYEKRGLASAVVETVLTVAIGRGVAGLNKEKIIAEVVEAAGSVSGKEQAASRAAEVVRKVVKNEKALGKIAAMAAGVAPVAEAGIAPVVNATRVTAAASVIHQAPPLDPSAAPAAKPAAAAPAAPTSGGEPR